MGKERQSITSSIIEISSKDNVTKEITMVVHKNDFVNGNGLDFKQEYVEKYKDTLVNKPVVAKYYPLKDDLGDHEPIFDSDGNIIGLETIAIGTVKEVWIADFEINSETTVQALYAKADLWNYKYPEIVTCVEKLFNDGKAETSVEVEIYTYGENPTQQYRYATDYCYIANCILGSEIQPADSNAGVISVAQKEVAMAVKKDLQSLENDKKGDVKMPETKEVFNKGFEIKFHGEFETSSLKFSDVRNQIYNALNPMNPQSGNRQYNYYLRDLYVDYVIAEDWNDEVTLYKIPYKIENDIVVISPKEDWQQGVLGFIPNGIEINSLISEKETELNELNNKLTQAKEELSTMSQENKDKVQELESTITELNSKIVELEGKITELNSTIVSQEEAKAGLEGQITELNSQIDTLKPFKEQIESAQKEAKITELNTKYSKLLSEDVMKSENVQKAIQELNETELNSIVVSEIAKQKTDVEIASKNDDSVTIVASKTEDLISQSLLQKYGFEA